jgi:hypothetical protein
MLPAHSDEDIQTASDIEAVAVSGLNAALDLAHGTAVAAGWYRDPATGADKQRNLGEVIALMHSEISEALEADRKGLKDDKLPHRDGREVEFADCLIRIFDTCRALDLDLTNAFFDHLKRDTEHEEPRTIDSWIPVDGVALNSSESDAINGLHAAMDMGDKTLRHEMRHWYKRNAAQTPGFFNFGEACSIIHMSLSRAYQLTTLGATSTIAGDLITEAFAEATKLILAASHLYGFDVAAAFIEKNRYNGKRADHKLENRNAEGGKKY